MIMAKSKLHFTSEPIWLTKHLLKTHCDICVKNICICYEPFIVLTI